MLDCSMLAQSTALNSSLHFFAYYPLKQAIFGSNFEDQLISRSLFYAN